MSFHGLPPEIHLLICEFVLQVGKSNLALVNINKYFYELAIPLLYRMVCLPTRRRVILFQYALSSNPGLSAHVRHILMADRNRDDAELPDFIIYWPQSQSERIICRQRIKKWLLERDQELLSFRSALRYVLEFTSPHLRSLTILRYEHTAMILNDFLAFPYLKLEELTIRGDYPPLPKDLDLPSLKRLHLASGDMPNPWASFNALTNGCPNLSHIRVTEPLSCILSSSILAEAFEVSFGLSKYNPDSLGMAVEYHSNGETSATPAPCLPPSLVELRLQPYPFEVSAAGIFFSDYVDMLKRLQALELRTPVFKLLPSNNANVFPYPFDTALCDWKDRMDSGKGCWK